MSKRPVEANNKCIICLRVTPMGTLRTHHHCCARGECERQYREILNWEKHNLDKSLIEQISKDGLG